MEEFKKLEWSWGANYENPDYKLPAFDFKSLQNCEVFNRTVNEINRELAASTSDGNHYLFKAPSTSVNSDSIKSQVQENRDPRDYQNTAGNLEQLINSVSAFPYSSRLREYDHRIILSAASANPHTIYNQNYSCNRNNVRHNFRTKEVNQKLKGLLAQEVETFKKCVEGEFYKNVSEVEKFVGDDWKFFFKSCWQQEIEQIPKSNYQIVTTIQSIPQETDLKDDVRCECHEATDPTNEKEIEINTLFFPPLSNSLPDLIDFRKTLLTTDQNLIAEDDLKDAQVVLSLNDLSLLLNIHKDFSVIFEIHEDATYKKFAVFKKELPPVCADLTDVLQFGAENSLLLNLERGRFDQHLSSDKKIQLDSLPTYKVHKTTNYLDQKFYKFVIAKRKDMKHHWHLTKDKKSLHILVLSNGMFYNEGVPINISIKLEYQTHFGVEVMTQEKLIEEWCKSYFIPKSLTYRYSVDVQSVTVLSLKILTLEDIEEELKTLYQIDTRKLFSELINLFGCLERLPVGEYLLQTKKEKRNVYKKVDQTTASLDLKASYSSTTIKENFNDLKWIPINCQEPGLIHIKNNFAPGTFPYWTNKEKYQQIGSPGSVAATNQKKVKQQVVKKNITKLQVKKKVTKRSSRKKDQKQP